MNILLLGFGGPERPENVRPFLDSVLEGVSVPPGRIEEVLRHYEIAGPSPYNAQVFQIQKALQEKTKIPIHVGFRHSTPSIEETCEKLKKEKFEKVICFVLSPFRSYVSFEKYKAKVDPSLEAVFTAPFHTHPLFIEAQAERILSSPYKTFYIFSAHSIPQKMDDESAYSLQFRETAALVAQKAGIKHWIIAYQSRSGNPADPWLEPRLEKVLEHVDRRKFDTIGVVPVGFLVDNVEILYDLDREFKEKVEQKGFAYQKFSPVIDHPKFVEMIAELVCQA